MTPVAGVAVIVTVVLLQYNGPLFVAPGVGGVIFCVTIVVALAVQPFTIFVTVTVNVPGIVVVVV